MRSFRLLIVIFSCVLIAACAAIVSKRPIINTYLRAEQSSTIVPMKEQYATFNVGDLINCIAEVKAGYRVEWNMDGKPRSRMSQCQLSMQNPGRYEMKLYVLDLTSLAPVDSVVWNVLVTKAR